MRAVVANLAAHTFVLRIDVKSNYDSIDHKPLFDLACAVIDDERVLALIWWQYIRRTVYDDGRYREVRRGLCRGCPLSPLMGALYLRQLDERIEGPGLFCIRLMDDWVVLAPTHWKLRTAIKVVNRILAGLKVEKHPDKTTIGRFERGVDLLGYHFSPGG